jgi:very-short-patch-repair endonuclease
MMPTDEARRLNSPPLQGRGMGWGLSANTIAEISAHARTMRCNPTEPEKRLWRILSNSRMDGFKFRRQAVIGSHIADFLCPAAKLVVEVDGDTHEPEADRRRDTALAAHGLRVLHIGNNDVMTNVEGVAEAIRVALHGAAARAESPHPNPSPEGEGLGKAQKLLGISLEGIVG